MMTDSWNRCRVRIGSIAAIAGVALVVAACGSSSSGSSASSSAKAPASNAAPSGNGVTVGTASGSNGTHLVGASGHALYLWVADSSGKSNCSGACAKFWPPLTTKTAPVAASGVTASHLATITRSGGVRQVTYDGHPLYYFAEDTTKGAVNGQGNNGFGAKWWLVAPSGTAITKAASGAAPASPASGY
jgi:predicted lipoprotein with Yx(FWY)xxD motif